MKVINVIYYLLMLLIIRSWYLMTRININKSYKQGQKSIEVNSGYVDEDNNLLIEELVMSEYVWLVIDDVIYPVDIDTKSLEYQTRLNRPINKI